MIALAGMAQAQLVQSGFENWTGGNPDGWMGSKTNVAAGGVTQVTDNVHGGTSAVRLANATTGHKRFTTQPVTVQYGGVYEVRFWVRGAGQARAGLYDGRADQAGYVYGTYATATSTWTEVVSTIYGGKDAADAQFVISVLNTSAPEHIVVDDVTVTQLSVLSPTPIFDIQNSTGSGGASPLVGQTVLVGGIVTGCFRDTTGYFIQSISGPWQGVLVYDRNNIRQVGDSVKLIGVVSEFNGNTEITTPQAIALVSSGNRVPAPVVVSTGDVADVGLEALESVLVRVEDGNCIQAPSGATYGKYKVDDGSGPATVGKLIYTTTPAPTLGTHYNITGVNYYAFGEYNIQPRMAADIEIANGIAEAGILAGTSVFPNPASDLLTLDLGSAAGQRVGYTLSDMQGRMIARGQVSDQRSTLSVDGLSAGLYHLTLSTDAFRKNITVSVAH
ncbi:MAG: T9SS type A sorting domain-containing protein [Flavobacteriales bacterium]